MSRKPDETDRFLIELTDLCRRHGVELIGDTYPCLDLRNRSWTANEEYVFDRDAGVIGVGCGECGTPETEGHRVECSLYRREVA